MIGLEDGFFYAIIIGGIIGIIWGIRKLVLFERTMYNLENKIEKIVSRIEKDEEEIKDKIKT